MKGIGSATTGGGRRKTTVGPPPSNSTRKDGDDDLILFHEMLRRERERTLSLLQPVSDEFDANPTGNYSMYKLIPSGKKGGLGLELLSTGNEKNDYDWLKTPPATPLFPSLEMEATGPQLAIQREIHIVQPVKYSRFSGKSPEASKSSNAHDGTKSKPQSAAPSRSVTPTLLTKSNTSSPKSAAAKPVSLISGDKARPAGTDLSRSRNATEYYYSKPKPRSRGVSPVVRSRTPSTFPGIFSDETPPNKLTSTAFSDPRSTSATTDTKPDSVVVDPCRHSRSPALSRGGRKVPDAKHDITQKDKARGIFGNNNGGGILGSRMVEKVMSARKSGFRVLPGGDGTGFGRMLSKSSLDMALKHMDMKGALTNDPIFHHRIAKNSTRRGNCGQGSADQNCNPGQGKEEEEEEAQIEKILGK